MALQVPEHLVERRRHDAAVHPAGRALVHEPERDLADGDVALERDDHRRRDGVRLADQRRAVGERRDGGGIARRDGVAERPRARAKERLERARDRLGRRVEVLDRRLRLDDALDEAA
ncbi:MAG: hypothetical protein IT374_04600 [Polyangiaceae bacterium]|nr:hypothetical protein [Polyangiaceae bacterium]